MIPTWIDLSTKNKDFIYEVSNCMKKKHLGQENAAKLGELLEELFGLSERGVKDAAYYNSGRVLRKAFETINQEYGGMVVSDTERGYWYASSLNDGLDAVEKNRSRARKILENAHQVEANILSAYGGQMGLI